MKRFLAAGRPRRWGWGLRWFVAPKVDIAPAYRHRWASTQKSNGSPAGLLLPPSPLCSGCRVVDVSSVYRGEGLGGGLRWELRGIARLATSAPLAQRPFIWRHGRGSGV